jgi:hypothetical protein
LERPPSMQRAVGKTLGLVSSAAWYATAHSPSRCLGSSCDPLANTVTPVVGNNSAAATSTLSKIITISPVGFLLIHLCLMGMRAFRICPPSAWKLEVDWILRCRATSVSWRRRGLPSGELSKEAARRARPPFIRPVRTRQRERPTLVPPFQRQVTKPQDQRFNAACRARKRREQRRAHHRDHR